MGRKNLLAGLDDDELTAVNFGPATGGDAPKRLAQPTLGSRGAVGAMSRSLEMISAERRAALVLGERIAAGQNVVEIDTGLIDPSFVTDRLKGTDQDHTNLKELIRQHGQQVPVLLRPTPANQGAFRLLMVIGEYVLLPSSNAPYARSSVSLAMTNSSWHRDRKTMPARICPSSSVPHLPRLWKIAASSARQSWRH